MSLSRWNDNSDRSMSEILEHMLDYRTWHEYEKDPLTDEDLQFRINKAFDENKKIQINGTEISFNFLHYEYERIFPGEEQNDMRAMRVFPISGYVIIYSDGTKTQYITNRAGHSGTKTILRKLINYKGKRELTDNKFRISEDLFTWMIYKVLEDSEGSLDEETHLHINQIIGFKGATNDKLATVIGSGNRIMNLLSTLAFLFENEKVTFIKPIVEYKKDTVEFSMDLNGSIDIDFETYVGDFFMDVDENEKRAKIILRTSLEILPKIITNYFFEIENDLWSLEIKKAFFKNIGEKIQNKINNLINDI